MRALPARRKADFLQRQGRRNRYRMGALSVRAAGAAPLPTRPDPLGKESRVPQAVASTNRRVMALSACLLTAWLACASTGCAVVKATQQPGKKNLNVLSQGVPRTHVIAELGPPVWSEERNGITTDVFAFKQGYSKWTKAGRAAVHGVADFFTLGAWEIIGTPAETVADGTDVKVAVSYDPSRFVESVQVIEGHSLIQPRPYISRSPLPPPAVEFSTADSRNTSGMLTPVITPR
jgi:hypothetical protein